MRQLRIFIILLTLISLVIATPVKAVEDGILAIVNDELITLNDLKHYIKTTYMNLSTQKFSPKDVDRYMQELEKNGLEKLIEERLILSKANQIQLDVNQEHVEEKLSEYKQRYPSEDVFMKSLIQHGGTLTDMYDKIKEQLKIKYVIDYEVRSKIYVNPYEITDYYTENKEEFQQKASVTLNSIFTNYAPDKQSAKSKIESAEAALKTGESFDKVAEQYSEMPPIGKIEKGQMVDAIENTVFDMNVNEVSDIIETEMGYFIFKVTAKTPEKIANLDEVKEEIKAKIFEQKFRNAYVKWLKDLKDNAYIEIKK